MKARVERMKKWFRNAWFSLYWEVLAWWGSGMVEMLMVEELREIERMEASPNERMRTLVLQ